MRHFLKFPVHKSYILFKGLLLTPLNVPTPLFRILKNAMQIHSFSIFQFHENSVRLLKAYKTRYNGMQILSGQKAKRRLLHPDAARNYCPARTRATWGIIYSIRRRLTTPLHDLYNFTARSLPSRQPFLGKQDPVQRQWQTKWS